MSKVYIADAVDVCFAGRRDVVSCLEDVEAII